MAEMLLINPRRRRRTSVKRKSAHRRRRNPATTRAVTAISRVRRRRNPLTTSARARRSIFAKMNPIGRRHRRRRNPIGGSMGSVTKKFMPMIKDALIGGAGSVAVDMAYGQIQGYLPASMQRVPGAVGAGDAVKAAFTVLAGVLLSKPTKGLSVKAAQGALIVQAAEILKTFVPSTMTMGYWNPAGVANMSARVGPIRRGNQSVARYMQPGATAMLNGRMGAYQRPGGGNVLLSGSSSARTREAVLR